MVLAPDFWKFWIIAAPVTVGVVIIWILWTQRSEIGRFINKRRRRRIAGGKGKGMGKGSERGVWGAGIAQGGGGSGRTAANTGVNGSVVGGWGGAGGGVGRRGGAVGFQGSYGNGVTGQV